MVAPRVAPIRGMLAAVDLDDEASLAAHKVDDELPYRFLTDELRPIDLSRTQAVP